MEINEDALLELKDLTLRALPLGNGRSVCEVYGKSSDVHKLMVFIDEIKKLAYEGN